MAQDNGLPTPNGWSGPRAIATFQGLNARCVATLAETAREKMAATECGAFGEPDLWRKMDQRAYERAATCPVLLVNLNFGNLSWWKRVCGEPAAVAPPVGGFILREVQARALLREVLMSVWRLGDAAPRDATLRFGMRPGISAEIAHLPASAIDRIAVDYACDLRPRWQDNDVFWKRLLEAAISSDDGALSALHLHCIQLLGSELNLLYE